MEELIKRLLRYSENCIAYKLDADFAAAVVEAINVLKLCQMMGAQPSGWTVTNSVGDAVTYTAEVKCEDERPSNADRIRAMSDEELVSLFAVDYGFNCPVPKYGADCANTVSCQQCFKEWLKQEAME